MDVRSPKQFLAAALAVALGAQSTGAASIPALSFAPPPALRLTPPPGARAFAANPVRPVPIPREPLLLMFSRTAFAEMILDVAEYVRLRDEDLRLDGDLGSRPEESAERQRRAREIRESMPFPVRVAAFLLFAARTVHGVFRDDPLVSRVEGRWKELPGLRYRVVFLESTGDSWIDESGLHAFERYWGRKSVARRLDPRYYGRYASYMEGDAAGYDIEVENTGATPIEGLSAWTNLEEFSERGARGPAVRQPEPPTGADYFFLICPCAMLHVAFSERLFAGPAVTNGPSRLGRLAPGARVALHRGVRIGAAVHERVNFEQLHLLLAAKAPGGEKILADDPQAGLVDPPGP